MITVVRPYLLKQQGSSLVLAIFVILALTLLGGALMKISSSSSETIAQEVLGARAYMAANSAMQAELHYLFPLNYAVGECIANRSYYLKDGSDNIPGLYACEATTSCDNYYTDSDSVEYYRLTSTGTCGTGTMTSDNNSIVKSSRTIQVEARSL